MPYFIIDKESKEFGFFGSLPVMVEKFDLDKSTLEYHFSRKKETTFENEKYQIFKGDLKRGGSLKQPLTFCVYMMLRKDKTEFPINQG